MEEDLKRFEKHCDVILEDTKTGEQWPMISSMLKCRSSFFEAVLSKEWNGEGKHLIKIEINPAWSSIRKWVMTGSLRLNNTQYIDTLKFADMYGFDYLISYVVDRLKNEPSFLIDESNIDFLFQPRFFEILMKHQQKILDNFFIPSVFFGFFAAIGYRDRRFNDMVPFKNSSWIARSSSYNYKFANGFYLSKDKNVEITLFSGLFLKFKTCGFATNDYAVGCDVYGVVDSQPKELGIVSETKDGLVCVYDSRGFLGVNQYFSKFVIVPRIYKMNEFIVKLDINGDSICQSENFE